MTEGEREGEEERGDTVSDAMTPLIMWAWSSGKGVANNQPRPPCKYCSLQWPARASKLKGRGLLVMAHYTQGILFQGGTI